MVRSEHQPRTDSATVEFRTVGEARLVETWRVEIPEIEALAPDELHDRLNSELHAGNCEFVAERAEDEQNREILTESIERL